MSQEMHEVQRTGSGNTLEDAIRRAILLGVIAVTLGGCIDHKPDIPGYHWLGSDLCDSDGTRVASVVTYPIDAMGDSQACIFAEWELKCTYWKTGQQAYDWIEKRFAEHENRP